MTIAAKLAAALTSVFLFAGTPAEATTPDTKPAAPAAKETCKTKPALGGSALGSGMGAVAGKPNSATTACAPEKPAKPAPQKPAPKP